MKKHLIAAAVAGAFAVPAMAQVTVYGLLDVGYTNNENKVSSTGVKTSSTNLGAGQSSTRIGFRGEEDLGGGLKATFVFELGSDATDTSASPFSSNRNSLVGLSGSFGSIQAGRTYTPTFYAAAALDPFGSANTGTYTDGVQPFMSSSSETYNVRVSDVIVYTAPTISGLGISVTVGSTEADISNVAGKTKSEVTGLGLSYAMGPFAARVGYMTLDTETEGSAGTDRKELVYGVTYDLGVAKLFAASQDMEIKAATTGVVSSGNEHIQIGVSVPMGALTLMAVMNDGEVKGAAGAKTHDSEGTMVGATYALSKRTNAYLYVGSGERKAVAAGGSKTDFDALAIGLRHQF